MQNSIIKTTKHYKNHKDDILLERGPMFKKGLEEIWLRRQFCPDGQINSMQLHSNLKRSYFVDINKTTVMEIHRN